MIDNNQKKIVVLGMHRSGTSVVTNLLAAAGCFIGKNKDLLIPDVANEQGYGERVDVLNTNNDILDSVGLDWMSAEKFKLEDINESSRSKLSLKIKKIIKKLDKHKVWVIKDPRLCITWPVWKEHIPNVLFIICQRDPLEVAKSLYVRDGVPLSVGFALWEHYSKSIIVHSDGYERILIDYQSLVKSPKPEAEKLISWLIENGVTDINQLDSSHIDGVINPKLYRQHSNTEEKDSLITKEQSLLFASFRDGEIPDVVNNPDFFNTSNNALELFNSGRLFTKKVINNQKDIRIDKLKSSLLEKEEIISQIKIQRQENNKQILELKISLQEKENIIIQQRGQKLEKSKQILELKVSLQEKENIIIQQRDQKLEKNKRISELKVSLQEKENIIFQLRVKKQEGNKRVFELKNSLQGKEISIKQLQSQIFQLQDQINIGTQQITALSESIVSLQKMTNEISHYNLFKFGGVIAFREELLKNTLEGINEIIEVRN